MSKPVPLSSQQEPSYNGEGGESLSKIELATRDADEILDELLNALSLALGYACGARYHCQAWRDKLNISRGDRDNSDASDGCVQALTLQRLLLSAGLRT